MSRSRIAAATVLFALLAAAPARAQALLHELTSPQAENQGYFGASVAGTPDVDGDGWGDLLVGARQEDADSFLNAGRAYVISGASGTVLHELESPNPEQAGFFGRSVAGVADVDGDGRGDLLFGTVSEGPYGRAYVFSGATGALLHELQSPRPVLAGSFGFSVAGTPDVDADGRGDLLIGAPREGPFPFANLGRAYVFSGATGALLHEFDSPTPEPEGYFGDAVAGVPDADGDGYGDLLIGAYLEGPGADGRAYLFSGATGALLHTLEPPDPEENAFGDAVAGVPDTDGDGRGDLLVSVRGTVYLFSGATGTLLHSFASPSEEEGDFGFSISGVEDFTGDGRGDLLVSARKEDPKGSPQDAGRVYAFSGASSALLFTLASPSEEENGYFGGAVAGVPDADGDGLGDLLVGATGEEPDGSPDDAGRAYLFSGATSTPDVTLAATALTPLIVAPGGTVEFRYTVTNHAAEPATGDLFFVAERGGVSVASDIVVSGTLAAGQSVTDTFVQQVPGGAPAGTYTYTLNVGQFPDTALDSEVFTVEVTSTARPPTDGAAAGWSVTDASPWEPEAGSAAVAEPSSALPVMVSPNPFAGRTEITFSLAEAGPVTLVVYDVRGRAVATPADGTFEAGRHAVVFEAGGLPSGVYVWRLRAEGQIETGRLTLVR